MKTNLKKTGNQPTNYWLLTSAVALTLGTVGLTTNAHAETTAEDDSTAANQVAPCHAQAKQVTLRAGKTVPTSTTPAAEASVTEKTTPETQPDQSTDSSETKPVNSESQSSETPTQSESDTTPAEPEGETGNYSKTGAPTARTALRAMLAPTEAKTGERQTTPSTPESQPQATEDTTQTAVTQSVDDLMPDKNLQQLVLYAIQQDHPEITDVNQITTDLLGQLTKLDMGTSAAISKQKNDQTFYNEVSNVKSLTGLEYAINLQRLVIAPNTTASKNWGNASLRGQLQDLAAIQNLQQLTVINLSSNQISDEDTKVLANLTSLTSLNLSKNNITNLSFITNLTNLTSINFAQDTASDYRITSLKPLAKLVNLSTIMLDNNNISDVSSLRHITATPNMMSFANNHIFDITPILGLNWQPFIGDGPFYNVSADGQTWTLDTVKLNPQTKTLSTWSFAYDNLYDFNEFMAGDPQSSAAYYTIGAANWTVWKEFTADSGQLVLNWDVNRHNDLVEPAAPNGLRFSGKIMVPYTLQENIGAVTVAFQLDGGVKIAPFVILSGQPGSTVDVLDDTSVQQAIADLEDRGFAYEKPSKLSPDLTKLTEDSTVTYNEDAQNITLLFNPLQKIYLVDEDGNTIGQKLVKQAGKTGTAWQMVLPTVDGYMFDRSEGNGSVTGENLSGTIQDINPDIYVYYKATEKPVTPPVTPVDPVTPEEMGTVMVHYQTQDGNLLSASETLTGPVGQRYATQLRTFANYQLVGTSGNATGTYTAVNQDVYYTYQLMDTTHETGDKGGQPRPTTPNIPAVTPAPKLEQVAQVVSESGQAAQIIPDDLQQAGNDDLVTTTLQSDQRQRMVTSKVVSRPASHLAKTTLPQTGERQATAWWGVALLAVAGGLWGLSRRKRF